MSDNGTIEYTNVADMYNNLQTYCREQGVNILSDNNKDFNRREMLSIFHQYIKRYVVSIGDKKK